MKLWMNREKIDPQKSLNALLYTMARNATFNFLKHKLVHDSFVSQYSQAESSESPDEIIFNFDSVDLSIQFSTLHLVLLVRRGHL